MKLLTTNGYDLFEMSSMIQKAIRRCDVPRASYAANELSIKYRSYLWKRLLTVSAEDCYGIITKEIIALKEADDFVNKKNKAGDTNDLFIAKAIILLCMARKNRDADYVACNFMWGDRLLTEEEFEEYVDYKQVENLRIKGIEDIPDYVFDCHTRKGRAKGKTQLDMFQDENDALKPRQFNLFDYGDNSGFFNHQGSQNKLDEKDKKRLPEYQKDKQLDPTEHGSIWTEDLYKKYNMK